MTERSRFWGGTSTGDATVAPYDAETEFAQVLMSIAGARGVPTDLSMVFRDDSNELAVTGGASPVAVATGRALVYGTWYENDAALNVAIPTPAASTRIDRIVARKSWAAQTVRITRIAGTEGAGVPAMTQVVGTTWDMPLYQVSITTGGVITLTDERDILPRTHSCNVHTATPQAIPNATHTAIVFDLERWDTDGFHNPASNPARITIPTNLGGKYLVTASIAIVANATGTSRMFTIRLNGGTPLLASDYETPSATFVQAADLTSIWELAAGDYIELYINQDSGGSLDTLIGGGANGPMCEFAVHRLGD